MPAAKNRRAQSAALGNGAKLFANIWRTPELDLVLRWSSTNRKEPEYITLELLPPGEAPKNLRASLKSTAGAGNLSEQVKQDAAGSRYLEIPMVDQGGKGYCVAATVERILRYYGSDIDQHVIAQLAASDANAGTSFEAMVDALEAADSRAGRPVQAPLRVQVAALLPGCRTTLQRVQLRRPEAQEGEAEIQRFRGDAAENQNLPARPIPQRARSGGLFRGQNARQEQL